MDRGLATRFRPPHSRGSCAPARRIGDRARDRGPGCGAGLGHRVTTAGSMKALILLLAIALLATPAIAQQRWERQVDERVQRAAAAVATSSPPAVVKRSGMLNTDETASFKTTLIQGTSYAIVAVCDDDCSRLQLTLLSPSGSDIAKERNSESLPTLHFTAGTTAVYGIRVVMEGCRWNPCWYAIAVVPLRKIPS